MGGERLIQMSVYDLLSEIRNQRGFMITHNYVFMRPSKGQKHVYDIRLKQFYSFH